MKRLIAAFLIITLVVAVLTGCPSSPHVFDEKTARHWDESLTMYQEDIARVAGVEDPADLKPEHFPIVTIPRDPETGELGDQIETITWDEYDAAVTAFKANRDYEYNKRDKDGNEIPGPEGE